VEPLAPISDISQVIAYTCKRNGLPLDERSFALLGEFVTLLGEQNRRVNLISRADAANIWSAHVLHSLALLFVLRIPEKATVLDLGTGGGFPGVPIAIVRPDLTMVHCDSILKKTNALREMIEAIGLSNRVLTGRAEELGKTPEWRHRFDLVLARAVAPLADLVRWSRPLLKSAPAGELPPRDRLLFSPALVAMKGGDLASEIGEARLKTRPRSVTVVDLDFAGHREAGLDEKKIVVVHP
jgi:16S rRNA (guanine527-N7)-methyltransferase